MNKTININIGGLSFNIDENAFYKLERYLKAIEQSLDPEGKEEIMKDIEMRISEIFSEKISSPNHAIDLVIIDEMISIMGQPEDYKIEDSESTSANQAYTKNKKLYRDVDNNFIGGVCAGFSHYLGIDVLWIRLFLVLLLFLGVGAPILVYIILWIVMPQANTNSKRMEMKGQPVNLSNIEKNVRENLENLKDETIKVGNKTAEHVSNFGTAFFNVVAKLIGVFIAIFSSIILITLIIGLFGSAIGLGEINNHSLHEFIDIFIIDDVPFWVVCVVAFLVLAIPFFFLLVLGLKLFVDNMNPLGNPVKYSLLGIWIISLLVLVFFAVNQANAFGYNGTYKQKIELPFIAKDTFLVSFIDVENQFDEDNFWSDDLRISKNKEGELVLNLQDISLELMISEETQPYMQIIKQAKGSSFEDANQRAENIDYKVIIEDNQLKLNQYFQTNKNQKFRKQMVKIKLYIPKNQYFCINQSVNKFEDFDFGIVEYPNTIKNNRLYQVTESTIKCMNCDIENNDETDENIISEEDNDTISKISIRINDKEVLVAEPKNGKLVIDKNGVITKK